jgi:hypothetical protein
MPFGVVTNTRSPAFKQPNERTNDMAQLCTVKLDSGCARADRSDQRCRELVHIDYACDFGLVCRCELLRSSACRRSRFAIVCACVRIESKWDSDYTADNTGCCAAVLLRTNWSVRFTLQPYRAAVWPAVRSAPCRAQHPPPQPARRRAAQLRPMRIRDAAAAARTTRRRGVKLQVGSLEKSGHVRSGPSHWRVRSIGTQRASDPKSAAGALAHCQSTSKTRTPAHSRFGRTPQAGVPHSVERRAEAPSA